MLRRYRNHHQCGLAHRTRRDSAKLEPVFLDSWILRMYPPENGLWILRMSTLENVLWIVGFCDCSCSSCRLAKSRILNPRLALAGDSATSKILNPESRDRGRGPICDSTESQNARSSRVPGLCSGPWVNHRGAESRILGPVGQMCA